jgi:hypothetical protein
MRGQAKVIGKRGNVSMVSCSLCGYGTNVAGSNRRQPEHVLSSTHPLVEYFNQLLTGEREPRNDGTLRHLLKCWQCNFVRLNKGNCQI